MKSSVTSNTTTISVPVNKQNESNTSDVNVPIGYKRCSHCCKILPVSEFHKNKGTKDGLHSWCKECFNESARRRKKNAQEPEASVHEAESIECAENNIEQPKLPFNYQRKVKRMQALAFAPDTKECSCCHKVKPMTEFSCNKSHIDGFENKCKHCMSEERKQKREQKRQEEQAMKKQQQNNIQTFEYLPIGTKLHYIHDGAAFEAPIRSVLIDITSNGALISYMVPTGNPIEQHKIYSNEVGSTVFTNPLDLINYFFKKQDMKYNIIK